MEVKRNLGLPRKSLLAAALSAAMMVGGCNGGGGDDDATTDPSTSTTSGAAIKGPVSGGTVRAFDANGVQLAAQATTGADGKFSIEIPENTALPVELVLTSGTDIITDQPLDMSLRGLVYGTGTQTANLSAATTLITEITRAKNNGSLAGANTESIRAATLTVRELFGFGMDAEQEDIDPLTSALTDANLTSYLRSQEAAAETLRRVTRALQQASLNSGGNGNISISQVFRVLAHDMADGDLDGENGDQPVQTAEIAGSGFDAGELAAALETNSAVVGLELLSDTFSITTLGETPTTLDPDTLANKMAEALPQVSNASDRLANLLLTNRQKNQLLKAIGIARKLAQKTVGSGNDAAYDGLLTAIQALETGKNSRPAGVKALLTTIKNDLEAGNGVLAGQDVKIDPAKVFALASNEVTVIDFPGGVEASHKETATVSDGVMTLNLNDPLSAANLANLANLAASMSVETAPFVSLELASLPEGSGTATVTAILANGDDATRDAGERYIQVQYAVNWSADGDTVTLTAPADSEVKVTYYTADASLAVKTTLDNADADVLTVSADGPNEPAAIEARIATLFDSGVPGDALQAMDMVGDYFYQVDVSGFPMTDADGESFYTVQGTFSVQ